MSAQMIHGAEFATLRFVVLQNLPADFTFGLLKLEDILHELVHIEDAVRLGIRDVNADLYPVHGGIENTVMEGLMGAVGLAGGEKPQQHGEQFHITALFGIPRLVIRRAAEKHKARRLPVLIPQRQCHALKIFLKRIGQAVTQRIRRGLRLILQAAQAFKNFLPAECPAELFFRQIGQDTPGNRAEVEVVFVPAQNNQGVERQICA